LAVALVNAFCACAMTGVIWFVQLVHYPLFERVGEDEWTGYHRDHTTRVTWVVAPLMVAELAASVVLAAQKQGALAALGLALAAATWALTFALAVPGHRRLEAAFDAGAARRLVSAGWPRTAAWTAHAAVALALLAEAAQG